MIWVSFKFLWSGSYMKAEIGALYMHTETGPKNSFCSTEVQWLPQALVTFSRNNTDRGVTFAWFHTYCRERKENRKIYSALAFKSIFHRWWPGEHFETKAAVPNRTLLWWSTATGRSFGVSIVSFSPTWRLQPSLLLCTSIPALLCCPLYKPRLCPVHVDTNKAYEEMQKIRKEEETHTIAF